MSQSSIPHALIIGAGSTGAALAHDLALRGLRVTVVERGEVGSGTTGRNHCLLHSGARYCLTDPASARECAAENEILRRILPHALELNGGLFVALDEADLLQRVKFLEACAACDIPARELSPAAALVLEPKLTPRLLAAVLVPDGVLEPYRFCLAFLASAHANGVRVRTFCEVTGLTRAAGRVSGAEIRDRRTGQSARLEADVVINAAGPWAGKVAALAGAHVPLAPTAGVMVAFAGRWNQRVINRLSAPSDGDIVVPIRQSSIVGTTSWRVDDPDRIDIPADHVRRMLECGDRFLPGLARAEVRGVMAAARPLVAEDGADERAYTRDFRCIDHAAEGASGFYTLIGGKTTTARLMAEQTADAVSRSLGWAEPCRTRETVLADSRASLAAEGES